jgi:hypothetical protein
LVLVNCKKLIHNIKKFTVILTGNIKIIVEGPILKV